MGAKEEPASLDIIRNVQTHSKYYNKCKSLLSHANVSKEEFVREYRHFSDAESKRSFYLVILNDLKMAILKGDTSTFKRLDNFIAYINDIEDKPKLKDFCNSTDNPIKNTNLVILACKCNKVEILNYIFSSSSEILNNLSVNIGRNAITFNDKDEGCHNALYYSVRSKNVELLDTLINKWPDGYSAAHSLELDETLSNVYEELQLKNVPLSNEMQIYVENKLIELRFFSDDVAQSQTVDDTNDNIKERINLIVEHVSLLAADYSKARRVDERFLFLIECIAHNINILKQQLKSTYNRIPWEEMEFCLISFISSHVKREEINLFHRAVFNKSKVLGYLKNFAEVLQNEKYLTPSTDLPKEKYEKIATKIIQIYPHFEELYTDYRKIRDVYSLQKMKDRIKLALSVDTKRREGQMTIFRAFQVIGDCLQNTLESPKLSPSTSKLLLLTLPENIREVIIDLRNSPSHAYSLARRLKLEQKSDETFFTYVKHDIRKINAAIDDALNEERISVLKLLLEKIIKTESLEEIAETVEAFNNSNLNLTSKDLKTVEHRKFETLINELDDSIKNKSIIEQSLINETRSILGTSKYKDEKLRKDRTPFYRLKCASLVFLRNDNIDINSIRNIKHYAKEALGNITPPLELRDLKNIANLLQVFLLNIRQTVEEREDIDLHEVISIAEKICHFTSHGINNKSIIEDNSGRLKERSSFIRLCKDEERCNKLLALKLSELKQILTDNLLMDNFIENLPFYENNKSLQSMIEMLVLDILSLLDSSNRLGDNLFFLDDRVPLLTGKNLRDHLTHENAIVNILSSNPSIMVVLNAKKLVSEGIINHKKNLGKSRIDCSKLRDKYNQSLDYISKQEGMFTALEERRLEDLKSHLRSGADINGRNTNSWTSLHFAAKGSSLKIVQFVLHYVLHINIKDIDGQSPLHIAAANGRTNIIKYFLQTLRFNVNIRDNNQRTPLHVAAENNHEEVVKILLVFNANIHLKDKCGSKPLHYAIRNNCINIVKILMQRDVAIDINEKTKLGVTQLHIAAESGFLELVNFLLDNKADINASGDKYATPLHLAVLNGHLEVVEALISREADIHAGDVQGFKPLHYAVRNGHKTIVDVLLKHDADPNAGDKADHCTPFHFAALFCHTEIFQALLERKANVHMTTYSRMTPLHFAAQGGHLEAIKILISNRKHSRLVHNADIYGATPLYYATIKGHKEIVDVLLENRVDARVKAFSGFTPLHAAVEAKEVGIAKSLIKRKAKVNAKDHHGRTPLHIAAIPSANKDVIELLLNNKAKVDDKDYNWRTPLHMAALSGCAVNVSLLLKYEAKVNAITVDVETPLHLAVANGHKEVVQLLIEHNADVNVWGSNGAPLNLAVENGHHEIVRILLETTSMSSDDYEDLLCTAVRLNYKKIVESLLTANNVKKNNRVLTVALEDAVIDGNTEIVEVILNAASDIVNKRCCIGGTILHVAAKKGHLDIVEDLISRKANVNAASVCKITALHLAAQSGHDDVVELLIENGAKINVRTTYGDSPLRAAVENGRCNIVKTLLDNGARIEGNEENRTLLEKATARGHLEIVKILLERKELNLEADCTDDLTLLHIASRVPNLEMVKYLVSKGANIHAENSFQAKPIHFSANKDIVEYYLSEGLIVNELDMNDKTPLHYATQEDRLDVVEYLVQHGADVSAKSNMGTTPLHNAAANNSHYLVLLLLENGAMYDAADMSNKVPLEMTNYPRIGDLLVVMWKFFDAVRHNKVSQAEECILTGAVVNARDASGLTALHYAAWKGYYSLTNTLLFNDANPNAVSKGFTPLHYAAKYSRLSIVKDLLSNNAIYNVATADGETPLDLATNEDIRNLLMLINRLFEMVKKNDSGVIVELNEIQSMKTIKAVMNAWNEEKDTLLVAAYRSKFSGIHQLLNEVPRSMASDGNLGKLMRERMADSAALYFFRHAYEKKRRILGPKNLSTVHAQREVARALFKQGKYKEALTMFQDIYRKEYQILGSGDVNTFGTRLAIALTSDKLGRNDDLNLYRGLYMEQEEVLGPNHKDTVITQFHWAMALDLQGKYGVALNMYRKVFEKSKTEFGLNDAITIAVENAIAVVLDKQGRLEEALEIHNGILERTRDTQGVVRTRNIITLRNIACILFQQNKYQQALKCYQQMISIAETVLGPNHRETFIVHDNMIKLFIKYGKKFAALKACMKNLHPMKAVLPPCHPVLKATSQFIESFSLHFYSKHIQTSTVVSFIQEEMINAAKIGNVQLIGRTFNVGYDLNEKDIEGKTLLHYAACEGHINVVEFLLKNAADIDVVCVEGKTPLHEATENGHKDIVECLLRDISHEKLSDFVNTKTSIAGATSLHIAAQNGSLDIVCCLLGNGAIYNVKDKDGKIPFDLSENESVVDLLRLIEELFNDAINGNIEIVSKLSVLKVSKPDEFMAATNASNNQMTNLLQIVMSNQYNDIASKLLKILN